MDAPELTPEQIDALSAEIDRQLDALAATTPTGTVRGVGEEQANLSAQRQTIETAVVEPADHFLKRFRQAAHEDLCQEGGKLHAQWQKWGDLNNPDVIRTFVAALGGMGISGNLMPVLVVPLAVIVLHLGVKAFCKGRS
jgi:hypothetical protein